MTTTPEWPHVDPQFYAAHGFCLTECPECARLDREEALSPQEALSVGIERALKALHGASEAELDEWARKLEDKS